MNPDYIKCLMTHGSGVEKAAVKLAVWAILRANMILIRVGDNVIQKLNAEAGRIADQGEKL